MSGDSMNTGELGKTSGGHFRPSELPSSVELPVFNKSGNPHIVNSVGSEEPIIDYTNRTPGVSITKQKNTEPALEPEIPEERRHFLLKMGQELGEKSPEEEGGLYEKVEELSDENEQDMVLEGASHTRAFKELGLDVDGKFHPATIEKQRRLNFDHFKETLRNRKDARTILPHPALQTK